jgi:hypothetical protein
MKLQTFSFCCATDQIWSMPPCLQPFNSNTPGRTLSERVISPSQRPNCKFFVWFDSCNGLRSPVYYSFEITLTNTHTHTHTHQNRLNFSGWVNGPSQRPLPDNTHRSQETDIHDYGGNRTRNPSKRETEDPHFVPCDYWNWRFTNVT